MKFFSGAILKKIRTRIPMPSWVGLYMHRLKKVLRENKRVMLVFCIASVFVDSILVSSVSDIVTFGLLLFYVLLARYYRLQSTFTFLFCLGLLAAMFIGYVLSGTSVQTEKIAVWLVLFMIVGIIQQWRE